MRNIRNVRTPWIAAAGWVIAGLLVFAPAQPGLAHASLVKSSPAGGAKLSKGPAEVRAWFDDKLAVKGSVLRLQDAHMKVLATGGVDQKVKTLDVMALKTPPLMAGTYTVTWVAVSDDDGATRKGSFKFSISAAAASPSGTMAMGSMNDLPALHLVTPADGARVGNPVALVIETPGKIEDLTMGTGMSPMGAMPGAHLHVLADGTTFMPAASQLIKIGPGRYKYTLPKLSAGAHTVKVFWADNKTHEPKSTVHIVHITVGA
jgi:methionine-rich copper-binding protein CopC